MPDETTPLLNEDAPSDPYSQFCLLIGIDPADSPKSKSRSPGSASSALYSRVTTKRKSQSIAYALTASFSSVLLLSQIVLGATLTALGASESSHVLITIFGVLNTIIAALVAYLKSRGQPMRARMFRDDLEHVVDEIENSKTMWLGVRDKVHGYDEIAVDDKVSVRSEVARLTRLYDSAVKKNNENNPDVYNVAGGVLDPITGLRTRPGAVAAGPAPASATAPAPNAVPAPSAGDADASPATAKNEDLKADDQDKGKGPPIADDAKVDKKDETAEPDAHPPEPSNVKEDDSSHKANADSTSPKQKSEGADTDAKPATETDLPKKTNDANGQSKYHVDNEAK